jgi:alpha-glucosidase
MNISLHWTAGLHHDGSALYVSNPLPSLGETVEVRLRVPVSAPIHRVFLRTAPDGEAALEPMTQSRADSVCAWWVARLKITMPLMHYRFKLMTAEGSYMLNAHGVSRADSPDYDDFKLVADFDAPTWLEDAVFYQIFPDRFYNGDPSNDVPDGAWTYRGFATRRRAWGEPPLPWEQGGALDFYGGDLQGIAHKLDYLSDLGVTALFLNPIFTAYTNHRYDIADYHQVDPHLGGDTALIALRAACDRAGMRLILDVTPNHCGWRNAWFTAAQADPHAPTASYFTFIHHPDSYESWLGHKSLVKLNYRSPALRDAMYRAPDSVMRYWLREPYRIDGWRLDVANMTARQGAVQLSHDVWRELRTAVKRDRPEVYLLGEHSFDGTPHLQGDELDASIDYQGLTIPLWGWLLGDLPFPVPDWMDAVPLPAEVMVEHGRRFRDIVPWAVIRQQFNQLGCHDTPRVRTLFGGDARRVKIGVTLMMTMPGVPSIYYGDEIGMDGGPDPDNRRCMIWDESRWDHDLRAHHQTFARLRRAAPALRQGGYQVLHAQGDLLLYQRQSADQRLLVLAYRGETPLLDLSLPIWHAGLPDGSLLHAIAGTFIPAQPFQVQAGHLNLPELPPLSALVLEG